MILGESGAVIGVRASDAAGLKDYLADAVVIATGGYGGNREMLETFVDPNADEMMLRGAKTATGDGLHMAREAGAMWVNMGGMASVHVAAVSPLIAGWVIPGTGLPATASSFLPEVLVQLSTIHTSSSALPSQVTSVATCETETVPVPTSARTSRAAGACDAAGDES